jgi:hypothetical protein
MGHMVSEYASRELTDTALDVRMVSIFAGETHTSQYSARLGIR